MISIGFKSYNIEILKKGKKIINGDSIIDIIGNR